MSSNLTMEGYEIAEPSRKSTGLSILTLTAAHTFTSGLRPA